MSHQNFLTLLDLSAETLRNLITRAVELKAMQHAGTVHEPLKHKILAMVFEKSSTRTRMSFEAGMAQLGGHATFLSPRDTQLGRGEPIEDSARVLSRMADVIMIRTFEHEKIERFTAYSQVPVINALTDLYHPCQLLADMQTWFEQRGNIAGRSVCWVGDGNNMANSWIQAAARIGFELDLACPEGYEPEVDIMAAAQKEAVKPIRLMRDPAEAVAGADVINVDVWASMGEKEKAKERAALLLPFQINSAGEIEEIYERDAIALLGHQLHCLDAHILKRAKRIHDLAIGHAKCGF